jgi:inosose dehydratase
VTGPLVGFNPLTWVMTPDGMDPDAAPPLPELLGQLKEAGFDAIHVEIPDGMPVAEYRRLLEDAGLTGAPGYFDAEFADSAAGPQAAERAARAAAQHAELGLNRIFIADKVTARPRLDHPGVGAGQDANVLARVIDNLARAVSAMVAEGVTPCLHQHVGTWIETEAETERVLADIDASLLLFGPDTGHLAWVGADPAAIIGRHLTRVGAVHLKDLHRTVVDSAVADGLGYQATTGRLAFTGPGRGDVDFAAVLRTLAQFGGWYVVEIDIPDVPSASPTAQETARVAADWVRATMVG